MPTNGRDIIVIGASAGGSEALEKLLKTLPRSLPASLFIVRHIAPESPIEVLLHRFQQACALPCLLAKDGTRFERQHVYLAPPDTHLLLTARRIMLTKGARENRYRPAIDPMFRSAAVTHGPRVIGVILTGMLDDGTSGMQAVQDCGGATVVQDPAEAEYPQMPESVLNAMTVRYCVPIAEMGTVLGALAREKRRTGVKVPKHIHTEAVIAERVLSDVGQVRSLGAQAPYNCPNCGGVLWEVEGGKELRYRCHTGHAYTAASLLTSQSDKIEETLWVSLRMFEERKNLLHNMSRREATPKLKAWYEQRAKESDVHVQRIRAMLTASQSMQSGKGLEPTKRRRKMKVV